MADVVACSIVHKILFCFICCLYRLEKHLLYMYNVLKTMFVGEDKKDQYDIYPVYNLSTK